MKIAILGAMREEIEPILERVENYKKISYAKNDFYIAKYRDLDLVIAYSKIGKVFASLTATLMIEKFGCQKLLFSGVAGAIHKEFKIGDLIIATALCQHDLDITAFGHPHGYVPEGQVCVDTDRELLNVAREVAKEKNINLKEGIIATGDQFIHNEEKKIWIENQFKAHALEMEGASVAVVCDAIGIPFFILRSISDSADMDAGFDFDKFLEKSSKISADFLMAMLDKINNKKS